MNPVLLELKSRLEKLFADLAGGGDVSPSLRLRTEGLMEAALLGGLADEGELDGMMEDCYRSAFEVALVHDFGDDWRDFYPFPQIPAVGRRAPVYPSTKE